MFHRARSFALAVAVLCGLALPAHATSKHFNPVSPPDSTLVQSPALGTPAEAELGRSMVTFSRATRRPAIRIDAPVSSTEIGIQLTIPSGVLYLIGVNPDGKFYEAPRGVALTSLGTPLPGAGGGLFVPDDAAQPMQTYRYMAFGLGMRPVGRISFKEAEYVERSKQSFRIEFIYTGCVGNMLTATYREFTDDTARPAFTQDLKYDITTDKVIGFKGARIQVLSANNTSISYVVQKGFDEVVE